MDPLMQWCQQFLSLEGTFVDFTTPPGSYIDIYEKMSKRILLIDADIETLDNVDVTDISFIVVRERTMILKKSLTTLIKNHYPPCIYVKDDDLSKLLSNIGYNIHVVSGCDNNIILAADHPEFKKPINKNIKKSTSYIEAKRQLNDSANLNLTTPQNIELLKILACEAKDYQEWEVGLDVCEYLLFKTPFADRAWVEDKLYEYMKPLPYQQKIWLNVPHRIDRVANNPSIIQIENGYLCNIRYSNYVYDPGFRFLDGGNVHLSNHVLVYFDKEFYVTKTLPLIEKSDDRYCDSFVWGIDDLRLIDEHRFICSHANFNNRRVIDQCLGTFDDDGMITNLIPLKGPNIWKHEKNWLPLVRNDKLYIIYWVHPFQLYEVNQQTGELILVINKTLTTDFCNGWRGSAPPLNYKNGYLLTVHAVAPNLSYYHRFVWIDQDFNTLKYSLPFYFEQRGIEFSLGLVQSHNEGEFILTHSVKDNHARAIIVSEDTIEDLFLGDL